MFSGVSKWSFSRQPYRVRSSVHNSGTTAIALLALTTDDIQPEVRQALSWLRPKSAECSSAYSLAWSVLAFLMHEDRAADPCIARLHETLSSTLSIVNPDTLSLAAIAISAAENGTNPFG